MSTTASQRLPAVSPHQVEQGASASDWNQERKWRSLGSTFRPRKPRHRTGTGGWWGNTTHAFDGVRSPRSARTVDDPFGTSPRFRRQTAVCEPVQSLASSAGTSEFRPSTAFGPHSMSSCATSLGVRPDGKMEHRFSVKLPIEKRQGDGGLSSSVTRWLDRGSGLPRDFRHIHLRPSPPVVEEKPRLDLEAYAVGDRVTPRPGTASFAHGGDAQQYHVNSGMIGTVMARMQSRGGCDVMVDFPMPPTEWDPAPRPMRLWMRAAELRLVQVAADAEVEADAAETATADELGALGKHLQTASEDLETEPEPVANNELLVDDQLAADEHATEAELGAESATAAEEPTRQPLPNPQPDDQSDQQESPLDESTVESTPVALQDMAVELAAEHVAEAEKLGVESQPGGLSDELAADEHATEAELGADSKPTAV